MKITKVIVEVKYSGCDFSIIVSSDKKQKVNVQETFPVAPW